MTSDSASRVTRSRRSIGLAITLFAAGIAVVGVPRAQQAPASAPEAPAAPGTGGPATAAPTAPVTAPAAKDKVPAPASAAPQPQPADAKAPPAGGANRPSQEHFEPTEKVRADFDVSFPVDI
jgi:hypothetical protein